MGGPRAADAVPRTQSERLRVRGAELKRIYLEMDSGVISMGQFRAKLRALEIVETPATSRLLRDPPVSFTALLKSLATNAEDRPPPTYAAGHVGPNKPMNVYYTRDDAAHAMRLRENFGGQRSGPARVRQWSGTAHAPAGGDVIAWRAPPRNTATFDDTRKVCDVGVVAAGSAAGPRGVSRAARSGATARGGQLATVLIYWIYWIWRSIQRKPLVNDGVSVR